MATYQYVINRGLDSERQIEAIGFATVGDFIDFFGRGNGGDKIVKLRVRAARVETVEQISA